MSEVLVSAKRVPSRLITFYTGLNSLQTVLKLNFSARVGC